MYADIVWLHRHHAHRYDVGTTYRVTKIELRTWGPRVFVQSPTGESRIVDAHGNVIAVWHTPRGKQFIAQLTDFNGVWQFDDVATFGSLPATKAPTLRGAGVIGGGPGGGTLTVGLTVSIDGSPGIPAASDQAPRPYRVVAVPAHDPTNPLAGICPSATGFAGFGWIFTVTTSDNTNGAIIAIDTRCVPLTGPLANGLPPGPAQPPTIGEIWRTAVIPLPTLGLSPPDVGVTGLATWMWSTSAKTVVINATIDGWTVVGIAVRSGFVFDSGEGSNQNSDDGGSPTTPALVHTFETKGVETVEVGTVWIANVTMTGPGVPVRDTNIGSATLSVSADYPVVEIRSRLIG